MNPQMNRSLLLLIVLTLLACRGEQANQSPRAARVMKYSELAPPSESASPSSTQPASTKPQMRQRMVIKTADLTIEILKYDEAFQQVQRIADQAGGFMVASNVSTGYGGYKSGKITLRIPSNEFDESLQQIRRIAARIEAESLQGNDITEEFYDLSARLENKIKAEKRYQEILKVAKNVKEILEVERALTDVREDVERLLARKRYLADQVDLSTINLSMHEPPPLVSGQGGFWSKVVSGFRRGIEGFGDVLAVTITFLIAAGPLLVVVILVIVLVLNYLQRRKKRLNELAE